MKLTITLLALLVCLGACFGKINIVPGRGLQEATSHAHAQDDVEERGHVTSDSSSDANGLFLTNADSEGDGVLLAEADVKGSGSKHSTGTADGFGTLDSKSFIDEQDANSYSTSEGGDGQATAVAESLEVLGSGVITPGGTPSPNGGTSPSRND